MVQLQHTLPVRAEGPGLREVQAASYRVGGGETDWLARQTRVIGQITAIRPIMAAHTANAPTMENDVAVPKNGPLSMVCIVFPPYDTPLGMDLTWGVVG